MKLFQIRYDGLWLGGISIVFAETEEEAIEKVKNHSLTIAFENVRVSELKQEDIVYNWNGDY